MIFQRKSKYRVKREALGKDSVLRRCGFGLPSVSKEPYTGLLFFK